jgi:hypothetical protein
MKNADRLLGFLGAMLVTFGISALNQENLSFELNQKAYSSLFLGIFLLFIFMLRLKLK